MEPKNFEFLRASHAELASLGGFVERYVHTDPPSALVKLRLFVEQMVQAVYRNLGLPRPFGGKLFDLLTQDAFEASIPPVVASKFHQIRIQGNKAAHGFRRSRGTRLADCSASSGRNGASAW
jgi:type I restriction enzyme R subunit